MCLHFQITLIYVIISQDDKITREAPLFWLTEGVNFWKRIFVKNEINWNELSSDEPFKIVIKYYA